MPAIVVEYNESTQLCKVQPAFKRSFVDGTSASRPIIGNVPVVFPRSSKGGVNFPVAKDDTVLLVFSQRSMDDWKDRGGEVELDDFRLHIITDAVAIPGLFTNGSVINPSPSPDAVEVRGAKIFIGDKNQNTTAISITPDTTATGNVTGGKAALTLPVGELDLITIVESLIKILKNCNYGGIAQAGGGPIDLSSEAALSSLESDIAKLKVT